jgi:hypothetical protein
MTQRGVHFVGSYPAEGAQAAMRAMIDGTGGRADLVPDGHRGPWPWLREHRFAVDADFEAFNYVARARTARRVLTQLGTEQTRPLTLLQGVAHVVDVARQAFGEDGWGAGAEILSRHFDLQIAGMASELGDGVVFQIESPEALIRARAFAGDGAESCRVASSIADAINRAPAGARFGVHLCLDDGHQWDVVEQVVADAEEVAEVCDAIATVGGAIADGLERPEALSYVHFPVVVGDGTQWRPQAYRGLRKLAANLPPGTRLVAGVVRDLVPLNSEMLLRDIVEDEIGGAVDIAAACGLGGRSAAGAARVVARMTELAEL